MCNFMSLRVVNLDNRPFYTVVKQIIKKAEAEVGGGGWMDFEEFSSSPTPAYRARQHVV